jgi:hypothetical protein
LWTGTTTESTGQAYGVEIVTVVLSAGTVVDVGGGRVVVVGGGGGGGGGGDVECVVV